MKTKEELNTLKEEVETVSRKLHELSEEELEKVTGGKTGAIPLRDDSVAARLADDPTNLEVIKRIEVVVGSGDQGAVKLAIGEAKRR